jgi:hypothetical protein
MSQRFGNTLLDETIKVFGEPDRWTQGADGRTFFEIPISPMSPFALKRSLDGALKFISRRCGEVHAYDNARFRINQHLQMEIDPKHQLSYEIDLEDWDNLPGRTQKQVLEMLKKVRAAA